MHVRPAGHGAYHRPWQLSGLRMPCGSDVHSRSDCCTRPRTNSTDACASCRELSVKAASCFFSENEAQWTVPYKGLHGWACQSQNNACIAPVVPWPKVLGRTSPKTSSRALLALSCSPLSKWHSTMHGMYYMHTLSRARGAAWGALRFTRLQPTAPALASHATHAWHTLPGTTQHKSLRPVAPTPPPALLT